MKEVINSCLDFIEKEYGKEAAEQIDQIEGDYLKYNEIFKFVHKKDQLQKVRDLWRYIAAKNFKELKEAVSQNGLKGCLLYWAKALSNTDCELSYNTKKDVFKIKMHQCPAVSQIGEKKYERYCQHCKEMYQEVLTDYKVSLIANNHGQCEITITKQETKK